MGLVLTGLGEGLLVSSTSLCVSGCITGEA